MINPKSTSCPLFLLCFLCFFFKLSFSLTDSLSSSQFLTNDQTLVSNGGSFEVGLFSPGGSSAKWYLGIWYKQIPEKTVVWVANRDAPLRNSSGKVQISTGSTSPAILLLDEEENIVWSSSNQTTGNSSASSTDPLVIQLLDTGNFVLRRENDQSNYIWQSFDRPTDTLLPGMKLGWDFRSGLDRNITNWKSQADPSPGGYCFNLDFRGFPEAFLTSNGVRKYRSGAWNGLRFSGVPEMQQVDYMSFSFVVNQDEVYYSFHVSSESIYSRLTMTQSGTLERYTWVSESQVWTPYWYAPKDQCDNYLVCGSYGVCDANASPVCTCLRGFSPQNPQAWNLRDGSDGCVRKTQLACNTDKFFHLKNVKVPESTTSWVDREMGDVRECETRCLRNCSCTAYANANISGRGSGCVLWFGELLDMRLYTEAGQDLFVRLAAIDADDGGNKGPVIIGISVGVGVLLFGLIAACLIWKRKRVLSVCQGKTVPQRTRKGSREKSQEILLNEVAVLSKRDLSSERNCDDVELPIFDFGTIAAATNNFADENKLGQGGFGSVYMGRLIEGDAVAVKRLSRSSGQGVEEFKNEVRLIARLQHRNLVRLLGCCIETDEKILIYEYMENRSLDSIIFDKAKGSLLSWQMRFNIICGIARGLLYLHQDSRFRIIHRDLKASNILLDGAWTPKISDFGMARIFGGEETEASTRRVVGTYGYMSPEYAMDGIFSVKSDVFSFGVLVLEIASGRKNRGFYHSSSEHNLLGQAWRLRKEGRGLELLDPSVGSSYSSWEVLRCIQVGLLCVQERSEDRPTMSSVVLMLGSETATMPQPKTPGYCLGRNPFETDSSSGKQDESFSVNQVTVTTLDAR